MPGQFTYARRTDRTTVAMGEMYPALWVFSSPEGAVPGALLRVVEKRSDGFITAAAIFLGAFPYGTKAVLYHGVVHLLVENPLFGDVDIKVYKDYDA